MVWNDPAGKMQGVVRVSSGRGGAGRGFREELGSEDVEP